jgi:hypothetical protein
VLLHEPLLDDIHELFHLRLLLGIHRIHKSLWLLHDIHLLAFLFLLA